MALFRPYRITSDQLSSLTKAEGQLIVVSDTKSMYLDISDTERIRIGEDLYTKLAGIATGATKVEASSTNGNIKINGTETTVYTKPALTKSEVTTALGYTPPTNDTNTTYTLTQDSTDGHKLTFTPSSGNATTITIPDNNTTYTAGTGISLSGTTFNNSGVRSIATGSSNGTISVNTNGTSADVAIKGLGNLAYKSSLNASDVGAIALSLKGAVNGVAELDANGKVPSAQLPSYVDDVLEYDKQSSFPTTGEAGKIYIAKDTNKTYRWSGSAYVEISASLALGETSSTAYRGDRGKTAYDHSQLTSGNPHNVTKSDVGLGNVGNFKAVSTVASQGLTDTEKSNARANIGAGTSNLTIGTTSTTAAAGNHTHSASLATDTGTSAITLAYGGKYKLTAGGSSVIFTMPASDGNTTYTFAEGSTNGAFSVTPSGGSAQSVKVHGLAAAAYKAVDSSVTISSTSTNVPTSAAVAGLISSALT